MVLVGPSGSGKSTALRMLAGLEEVDDGGIWIGGVDVTYARPKDRDVAMVFQNYALYPYLTVAQNIAFPLKMARIARRERDLRVREVAELLGLADLLDRKPAQLSGGQRQRVAMGRAMIRSPQAYLMDEPLSNLDAKLRVQMRAEIAELQARLGVTTVYVTHDQSEAMTLGHRVAVLRDGRLQQCAPPQELYDRPANAFVAGFIGSPAMSLMEVPLGGNGSVDVAGVRVPCPADVSAAADGARSRPRLVGLRPEALAPRVGAASRHASRRSRCSARTRTCSAARGGGRGDAARDARRVAMPHRPVATVRPARPARRGPPLRPRQRRAARIVTSMSRDAPPRTASPFPPRRTRRSIRSGDHVFTAGQVAHGAGRERSSPAASPSRRPRRSRTCGACLAAAGCGLDDVQKVNVFLADLADFAAFNDVYRQAFSAPYPARTTVQVGLPPGLLIEVEAVARLPGR